MIDLVSCARTRGAEYPELIGGHLQDFLHGLDLLFLGGRAEDFGLELGAPCHVFFGHRDLLTLLGPHTPVIPTVPVHTEELSRDVVTRVEDRGNPRATLAA